jgi:peptide/nickel transport system substrate-binding protein
MSNNGRTDLDDEVLDRWHWFYRKGMIGRRDMLRALAVAGGGAALAACAPTAPAPAKPDAAPAKPAEAAKPAAPAAADPYGKPAAPAPAAKSGAKDIINVGFTADLRTMDPHMHNDRFGIIWHYHVNDNLGVRDPSTNRIVPHLATSWKPVEPTVWEMELRKDVKFHNGDPFDAEVVKFNWERVINPDQKSQQKGNHEAIKGVEVVDAHKVRVHTTSPYPVFVERLQNFQFISPKVAKEKGDNWLAENLIGTGPFKFVEWKRDQYILAERNDEYWGPKAAFKQFKYVTIPELTTQIAELLNGNLDVMRAIPTDQVSAINNSGRAKVSSKAILRVFFVRMDARGRTSPNPFQDVRVRHAANHAVDIDGLIKSLQPGGDRAPAMVNPLHFGYDGSIKPHAYDPELAKKLMAEAGHANGFDVTWNSSTSQIMPNAKAVYEAMQQQLARVGIRVKFQIHEARAQDERNRAGQGGPMHDGTWGSYSVFDADGILWDMLHSSSPFTYNEHKELDQLLLDARSILEDDKRKVIYAKAQQIIRDDAPMIFGWGLHQLWGVNNAVNWAPDADEIDKLYTAKPA